MDKKSGQNIQVSIGGNVNGEVNVAGRDLHITESAPNAATLEKLFDAIFKQIDELKTVDHQTIADVKPIIEEVKTEVAKDDLADNDTLARHLRNIARMAPDIFDVVTATLVNPATGIGVVIQKIANKARQDAGLT